MVLVLLPLGPVTQVCKVHPCLACLFPFKECHYCYYYCCCCYLHARYTYEHTHGTAHVWRSQDNSVGLIVLFVPFVGLSIDFVGLGSSGLQSKYLYDWTIMHARPSSLSLFHSQVIFHGVGIPPFLIQSSADGSLEYSLPLGYYEECCRYHWTSSLVFSGSW